MILDIVMAMNVVLWGFAIYGFAQMLSSINTIEKRLDDIENPPPTEQAPRFRQRTAESDPGRQSKIKSVRLRAKRTVTPDPRPPRKRKS